MKNYHQQHGVKGYFDQDQEQEIENEKIIRGRAKKNGAKRPAVRKSVRKSVEKTPQANEPKNPTVRKSVSRFMKEGTLFRDTLNEMSFGHDDYQLRQNIEFDRFSDDDMDIRFPMDSSRGLSVELEEENQGTYSDQQLVREIRRAVERDSAVSSSAQKIQLTAKNGVVILKGTVSSEQEQMIIEDKAVALAGFGQVVNQLEVIEDILE